MDLQLSGRTALITGAGKGIGRAIAERLHAEGCNLVLVGRTAGDLQTLAGRLNASRPHRVETACVALPDEGAIAQLAADHAGVDIVINNAGAIPAGYLKDLDVDRWRNGWDGKVFGYIGVMRAFLAIMEDRGRGVILNIIGAAGERPSADYVAGSAGNAALMALTRALGASSPTRGVRVLGINPGPILTDRLKGFLERRAAAEFGNSEDWPKLLRPLPFGRAGKPEEVAATAAFLVSDHAGYMSGTIVTIDGGITARGTSY
jgi:3-oxoacyl-[acyl-carrier protein] reductase